jgi:hypothetical protein
MVCPAWGREDGRRRGRVRRGSAGARGDGAATEAGGEAVWPVPATFAVVRTAVRGQGELRAPPRGPGSLVVSMPMSATARRHTSWGTSTQANGTYAEQIPRPGVLLLRGAERDAGRARGTHRADGRRQARGSQEPDRQEADRLRHRLRSLRAGGHRHPQGRRCAHHRRLELLPHPSRAGDMPRRRSRRRPARRRPVRILSTTAEAEHDPRLTQDGLRRHGEVALRAEGALVARLPGDAHAPGLRPGPVVFECVGRAPDDRRPAGLGATDEPPATPASSPASRTTSTGSPDTPIQAHTLDLAIGPVTPDLTRHRRTAGEPPRLFTAVKDLYTRIRGSSRLERPLPSLRLDQDRRQDPLTVQRSNSFVSSPLVILPTPSESGWIHADHHPGRCWHLLALERRSQSQGHRGGPASFPRQDLRL